MMMLETNIMIYIIDMFLSFKFEYKIEIRSFLNFNIFYFLNFNNEYSIFNLMTLNLLRVKKC